MFTGRIFLDLVLFLLLLQIETSDQRRVNSKAIWKRERGGKFLFNIVQFSNTECNATATDLGICYTHSECDQRGGSHTSPCAAGFGVCCLFRSSGVGEGRRSASEKISYFTNSNWPLNGSGLQFATHSIWIDDSDVCQVRLDFEKFELAGPSLTHFPIGECDVDRLVIFSVNQDIGLSGGNQLCGNMTGQHIYLDVDPVNILDPIRLFAFVGNSDSATYLWNIKITLIDCKLNSEIQAPPGCRQYFPQSSGSFQTFNYGSGPGSPYLANTRYAVCFKRRTGLCGIELTADPGEFILNSNLATQQEVAGSDCHNYTINTNNDFIQILGSYSLLGTSNKIGQAYYCGGQIGSAISPIYASHGPLVVLVTSDEGVKFGDGKLMPAADDSNSTESQENLINERERGFRLKYSLTSC